LPRKLFCRRLEEPSSRCRHQPSIEAGFFSANPSSTFAAPEKKSQNSTLLFFFAGETKGLLLIREKETIFRDDNFKGHRGENKSFLESQKKIWSPKIKFLVFRAHEKNGDDVFFFTVSPRVFTTGKKSDSCPI
jgi:hypothetical protein